MYTCLFIGCIRSAVSAILLKMEKRNTLETQMTIVDGKLYKCKHIDKPMMEVLY